MGILDDMKKLMTGMTPMATKPTEPVPYERPTKDGRTSTGFAKPQGGGMGNQNANKMMQAIEDDEMNRRPKGK